MTALGVGLNSGGAVQIHVEGATCINCMRTLETLPRVLPTLVGECSFDFGRSLLKIRLIDQDRLAEVFNEIREMGFNPNLINEEDEAKKIQRKFLRLQLIDLGIAAALAGNIMLLSIPLYTGVVDEFRKLFEILSLIFAVPSVFYCGRSFFKNVYTSLRKGQFSIDAPILFAILVAFFYSVYSYLEQTHTLYFDSVSALVFLLLASRYYLARLQNSHQLSLNTLQYFQKKTDVQVGEYVTLTAGILSFDGVIRSGEVWVDTSKFSGESTPTFLSVGDRIFAGTEILNQNVPVIAEVQCIGEHTRIANLLESIHFSQFQRSDVVLKSDQLAKGLLKVVLAVSAISLGIFFSQGMFIEGLRRVLALLIVTCPCALALGTPLVFVVAMKNLLSRGVLVKNPNIFEKVLHVSHIAFDKTGTLTEGKISIIQQLGSIDRVDQKVLYSMVCRSHHPVSSQIQVKLQAEAKSFNEKILLKSFKEIPGKGLEAFDDEGNFFELKISEREFGEYSSVAFRKNNSDVVEYVFQDCVRSDSAETIRKLSALGYQTELLSGDKEGPVRCISQALNIGYYRSLCSPEEKAANIKGKIMLGDGLNDALALSQAAVGIAVKGGLNVAIESSDVYSLKPGVSSVLDLIYFSKVIDKTIRQNFIFSSSYNLIGAILSLTGWMSPILAAVLMPLSATTVFFFSLYRLSSRSRPL